MFLSQMSCHPERSVLQRSRKPALSEAEGDLLFFRNKRTSLKARQRRPPTARGYRRGCSTIRTPMLFSLVRACAASGVCGCRWISVRSS
jgi:hypothetical protein